LYANQKSTAIFQEEKLSSQKIIFALPFSVIAV